MTKTLLLNTLSPLLVPDDADPAGANVSIVAAATAVATPSAITRNQELNCRTCDNHYEKPNKLFSSILSYVEETTTSTSLLNVTHTLS